MHCKNLLLALSLTLSPALWAASNIELNSSCPSDGETDSSIDYTYSISNKTSKSLRESTITITLDSKLGYLGYSGSGWQCSASGNLVNCTSTSKIKKNKTSSTLVVSATTPATTGTVNSTATASSQTKKSNSRNNQNTAIYTSGSIRCSTPLLNPAPGSFNIHDSAGSCAGKAINTKITGNSFPLRVTALNSARTSPDTTVNDLVEVYLLDFSSMVLSPSNASSNCPNALSLNSQKRPNSYLAKATTVLAGGYGTVIFPALSKVYRKVGVFTVNTANINNFACGTDLFAIRPQDFVVTASDAHWKASGTSRLLDNTASSGGNVHAAGRPFTLTATARDAGGSPLASYNALPASYFYSNDGNDDLGITPQVSVDSILHPSGGDMSEITAAFKPLGSAGQIRATDATYSEAGSFLISVVDNQFAIEDGKNSCSTAVDRDIRNNPAQSPVGRFIPEILTVTALNTPQLRTFDASDSQCPSRKFTYIGQPFGFATIPELTIKAWAYDADGEYGQTGNHRFASRLGTLSVSSGQVQFSDSAGRTLDSSQIATITVTDGHDGSALLTLPTSSKLAYTRGSSTAPFNASLSLTVQLADCSDKNGTGSSACIPVCLDPKDLTDSDGVPPCASPSSSATASFSSMAFDASGTTTPNAFRYGYLSLPDSISVGNASTAATLDLEAKYWTGSTWSTNTLDNCSDVSPAQFTLSDYKDNLKQCGTLLSNSGKLVAGKSTQTLSAPGSGKNGSVKLMPNLGASASGNQATAPCSANSPTPATAANLPWLQCDNSLAANCVGNNPQSTISFGGPTPKVNRTRYIYLRENY